MSTFIGTNETTVYGRLLKSYLLNFEASTTGIGNLLATMSLMLDGDGSQDAHYTTMMPLFGYTSTATMRAAYNELNALWLKISTDASVTNVKTAMAQAFAKFR